MSTPPTPSRFAAYQTALKAVSARTGTPLSSLIVSFGILHELTAVLPIVGVFYASRSFGVGERVVNVIASSGDTNQHSQSLNGASDGQSGVDGQRWMVQKGQMWIEEGEKWAARVGRRYGWFGFEKRIKGDSSNILEEEGIKAMKGHIAGDVANAVVAYAVTKALLPLRIGASLYLSPAFSRRVVEPCRQLVLRPFRKRMP